jgi:hypothetical protein
MLAEIENSHYEFFLVDNDWVNLHSHFFDQEEGKWDVQLVLNVGSRIGSQVILRVVEWVRRRSEPIEAFRSYTDILNPRADGSPVPLQFSAAEESGRRVWRILLPDPSMRFGDQAEYPYSVQASAEIEW